MIRRTIAVGGLLGVLCAIASPARAQQEDDAGDAADDADLGRADGDDAGDDTAEARDALRRKTASGSYSHPSLLVRIHGYATLMFTVPQEELGAEQGATPQILIAGASPRTGDAEPSFINDAAIIVGGEPTDHTETAIELHFIGNALTPVLTEAKVVWELLDDDDSPVALRLTAGRYWWPFGIHDTEWFSAVNAFALQSPVAGEVVPAHYNEVGVALSGEILLGDRSGLNYVLSVGNGVPSFELSDAVEATPFDFNKNKTVTGRTAFVIDSDFRLEVGVSGAIGRLRAGQDASLPTTDPSFYASKFVAAGADVQARWREVGLRGYYYLSREELEDAPRDNLVRQGLNTELSYQLDIAHRYLRHVTFLGRYSFSREDTLAPGRFGRGQYAVAARARLSDQFEAGVVYAIQAEHVDMPNVDNNVFITRLTGSF